MSKIKVECRQTSFTSRVHRNTCSCQVAIISDRQFLAFVRTDTQTHTRMPQKNNTYFAQHSWHVITATSQFQLKLTTTILLASCVFIAGTADYP